MTSRYLSTSVGVISVALLVAACSSSGTRAGFGDGTNGSSGASGSSGSSGIDVSSSSGSSGTPACVTAPGNYDFPGNNCDDDGDGTVDNPPSACDANLSIGAAAGDFAKAMGMCNAGTLLSAEYLRGYNTAEKPNDNQHGILRKFGNVLKPREGASLGVISTGFAREFNASSGQVRFSANNAAGDGGGQTMGSNKVAKVPTGYPKKAVGCPAPNGGIYDAVNVKLKLKAPSNAKGFSFDFNFMSSEWPVFVCSPYTDAFIAYVTSKGKTDNISFDAKNNPVSVNLGFLDRCTPNAEVGCCKLAGLDGCDNTPVTKSVCAGGPAELGGTGFGITDQYCADTTTGGAGTGWLTTSAPIEPNEEFTIEFMIWDTSDSILDSSVLLDNFRWVQGAVTTVTERVN